MRVDDELLAIRLRAKKCFVEVDEADADDEVTEKPVDKLSKAELLDLAKNEGVEVPEGASKKDLVKLLGGDSASA